jgi:hypothetical protein
MNMRDQTDLTELIIELKKYGAGDPTKSDIEALEKTRRRTIPTIIGHRHRRSLPSFSRFIAA